MNQKSREYLKLNKNILLAFAASIVVSAAAAQALAEQADYLNSTYTLIVDFLVYFSTFGGLYYLDNRKRYVLPSGQTDKENLRRDLMKIITSLGIAEVVYTIARWILQYYFLTLNHDAYLASVESQVLSTIIYMVMMNIGVKLMRLYKDEY